jgi:Spx/MgsR family transcriptional regulator
MLHIYAIIVGNCNGRENRFAIWPAFIRLNSHAMRYRTARDGFAMTITIYGIKNCDTMKKARTWLEGHGIAYDFHDYKAAGIDRDHLERWTKEAGWEVVLNRAGTTFKALSEADRIDLSKDKAIQLMLAQPSMIKRPVLEADGKLLIGFKPDIYAAAFGKA